MSELLDRILTWGKMGGVEMYVICKQSWWPNSEKKLRMGRMGNFRIVEVLLG